MKRRPLLTVAIVSVALSQLTAADWPQFRHDAGHTAASPESLPEELHLAWIKEFAPPKPAFPNEVRLRYDASYEPVVMDKTMFVPSMVTDTVTALDTETGAQRWRFFTDGPVRFAPLAWEQKVYFVSDDGYLYCVRGEDGKLIWKLRGLPENRKDRKLLGDGRLISLWPARGGPVLAGGIIYFAAGFWPAEGVYIHAVDATTGDVVWSNTDSNHISDANMDHGVSYYAGLTPQGYLAVVGETLVVPCGAQLPAFLDLKTGALRKYTMGWGGRTGLPKGTWWVAGTGKYLVHGGDLYDISRPNEEQFGDPKRRRNDFKRMLYPGGFTRLQIDRNNQKYLTAFGEPVLTADTLYANNTGIVAYDLSDARLEERLIGEAPKHRRNDHYPDRTKANFRRLWKLPFDLKVHIKAGRRLYASHQRAVVAIDIPDRDGGSLQVASWTEIAGTPHRMLASDGKLFVVTREGKVYAFSGDAKAKVVVHSKPEPAVAAEDLWTEKAAKILQKTGVHDGYALVNGVGSGRLAEELVRQSNCHVIVVDEDPEKVAILREKLHSAGQYGTRIVAHLGDPMTYPLPPYLANLVVSEEPLAKADQASVEAIYHLLRPYGGTACLQVAEKRDAFSQLAVELFGSEVRWTGGTVLLSRQAAIPGSADWSHRGADAANSGASQEQSLTAPLGVLWFDGSLRWNRQPGNAAVRVCGGRIFVHAQRLYAVDVFTGRHLWQVVLPSAVRRGGDFVAVDENVFVTSHRTIVILDPATGQTSRQLELPGDLPQPWSDVRVLDQYLVGTSGKYLVCMNHRSGQLIWKYECARAELSIALGNGKVFCAEVINKRRGESEDGGKTRALDIASGQPLWEMASGSQIRYSQPHDLLVTANGVYKGSDGSQVRTGGISGAIIGDRLVVGGNDTFALHDLFSGERMDDELSWNRRGCTSLRASWSLLTTRFHGNAAFIDLASKDITSLWGVRSACSNNLFPANGVLNAPNLTGGCTCNYTPASQAFVPRRVIQRLAR